MTSVSARNRRLGGLTATIALVLSGCASSDRPAPGQRPPHPPPAPLTGVNKPLQTLGSTMRLGPMSVLNVYPVPPRTEHYEAGQDAVVRLTSPVPWRKRPSSIGIANATEQPNASKNYQ